MASNVEETNDNTPGGLMRGEVLLADGVLVDYPAAEKFRILRSKLERINLGEKKHSLIAVTSALPKEGKSVTSVNLSRALGCSPNRRALLVDCDLRCPTAHLFFNLSRGAGLTDVLVAGRRPEEVIRRVEPGLDIITAGSLVDDPTAVIEHPSLAQLLRSLANHYGQVIVDCPPVLLCPEPITISTIVDSTLLVVRGWKTDRRLVQDAIDVLGKQRILGMVMNDAFDASRSYLYYGYYYGENQEKGKRKKRKSRRSYLDMGA